MKPPARGEHALVVGGSRGLGRELVRLLAASGLRVSVLSRRGGGADGLGPNVRGWRADLPDRRRLDRVLGEMTRWGGPLSRLALFQRYRGAGDSWEGELAASLTATRDVVDAACARFPRRGGAVVIVSSVNARLITPRLPLSYHVAKAGLEQMVRWYAAALGPRGIRVNGVSPGTMLKEESRARLLRDRALARYARLIPLGRLGEAREAAEAAAFLLDGRSSYVSGQCLTVDGGASVRLRPDCRLCASREVERVLRLKPSPPVDAFVPAAEKDVPQESFPLDVYLCRACGHVQMLDVVDPKLLFGRYIYETASSPGLVEHFRRYAQDVLAAHPVPAGALAVDVGSNDGTLLRFFKERGLRVLGVDPAREIGEQATRSGVETVTAFFDKAVAERLRRERGPAALVTANNVFAHSDDLGGMADGVRELLADDGLFVFEVSYLLDLVERMIFDFIYHEHLSHHSVRPLRTFLRAHGLELVDVIRNDSKGGTLRGFAQKAGGPRPVAPAVARLEALENERGLYDPALYRAYDARIEKAKADLRASLAGLKGLAGYGASATGTVLLHHFELGGLLDFIVDDNPQRQGLFSPGHHLPVLAPAALYERRPRAVVVLAWRFADMILAKHRAYTDAGGEFIVPLPQLRRVGPTPARG